MRASADPSGQSPMRRLALLGLLFVAAILSCGKDVTGPRSAAGRFVRGISWEPIFPAAFQAAGGTGSGIVQFSRVHVVLHHSDGTVALDTTIDFPAGADSITLDLTVKLLDNAPPSGEPMTLNLGYLNAAGDTVFKGGPVSVTASPPPAGGGSNPPVQVPVSYTGPGSHAVSVAISPRSGTVVSGAGFSFTAIAKDVNGVTLAGTPIIWNSLDPAIATITSAAAGNGLAQNQRGTARIIAQLLTGPADTVQLFVLLPASNIVAQSGNGQFGVVGTNLALPLVVKVAATDGVGVAGTTVHFAVATGGGSVGSESAISDASGLAQTTFKLGTGTGAQTVTATAAGLNNSPVTFIDTAQAATASKLVVTTQPVNGVAGIALTPVVFTAEDNNGNIATAFTGPVAVAFGTNTPGATLSGTVTVNAFAGVATFNDISLNKVGIGYTLTAASTGLTGATSSTFNVTAGPLATITVTPNPSNLSTGGTQTFTAVGKDVNGNIVVIVPAWSVVNATAGSINGSTGLFTAGTVSGTYTNTVQATSSGISGFATVNVAVGALATITVSPNPSNLATGGTQTFTAVGKDVNGNIVVIVPAWSVVNATAGSINGSTGLFTAGTVSGTYTNTVQATSGGISGFATVNVAVGALASITVSPSTSTLSPGGTQTFTAVGKDVNGNIVGIVPAWSVVNATAGTINGGTGLFTAGTVAGTYTNTVQATSGGISGFATVNVTAGAATQLKFTTQPTNATAATAIAPVIVVTAKDAGNNTAGGFVGNVTLTFGANPGGATLSGTATVAAVAGIASFNNISLNKAAAGYTLNAASGALTPDISTAFNITAGPATTIAVSAGHAQSGLVSAVLATPLAVLVTDANANPVAGRTINWAVTSGGGSVALASSVTNAAGIATDNWTLGAAAGPDSVTATSAGLAGSPVTFTATATVSTANKTWTGATNNVWATATNWSPAVVPATTDSVFIPITANNPQLAANATVADLYIASGATLTLTSGAVTLGVNGALDATGGILGTGNVALTPPVSRSIKGSITAGTTTLFGPYTQNGSFIVVGNLVNNSGGSLIMNGNTTSVTGNFSTAGSGTLTMNNAVDAFTVTGNVTFGGGNETGLLTAGNLFVTGGFTQASGSTSFIAAAAHTTTLNGTVAQTVNFANPFPSTFGAVVFANTAGVTLQTNMISNGAVTVSAGAVSGTAIGFTIGGTLTDPSALLAVPSISFTGSTTPVAATTPTINASVTFNNKPSILAGNLTVNGAVSVTGNLQLNKHYLVVNGTFGTVSAGQLTMTDAADSLSVTGTATFGGGSTGGILTNGKLKLAGSFSQVNNGSGQEFSAGAAHTTLFTGTTPTISFANPTTSSLGKVQLQTSVSMTFSTDVRTTGDVWLKTGSTPSVTNAGGNVTIGGALYDTTGGRWQVANTTMSGAGPLPKSLNTNLTIGGALTLTDSLKLTGVANTLTISAGSLTLGGHSVKVPGTFSTTGSGTFSMTNTNDSLVVTGNATFSGGATTGLLTNGNLVVGGTLTATGLGLDASGSHTTTLNSGSSAQAINWTSAVAGHGLQNLIFRNAGAKSFSGSQGINGNVTLATSVTSGVTGAYNISIAGSGITDSSSVGGGAWQVGTTIFTGTPTVIPSLMSTSTLEFAGGTMVSLPNNVSSGGSIIVDGTGTNLKLNGNVLTAGGTSTFTTQNGGTLQMTLPGDSLKAYSGSFFNGGSTTGLLIAGAIRTAELLQGYTTGGSSFVPVAGASPTAFSASAGNTVFIANGGTAYIKFANPGTGATGSHFGALQYAPSGQLVVMSDVFVDDSLYVTFADTTSIVSDSLSTAGSTRLITAQGLSVSTTSAPLTFGNVALQLVDGQVFTPGNFDNVIWKSFPANYTGDVFTVNRIDAGALRFTSHDFSGVTLGTGGHYLRNLGKANVWMVTPLPSTVTQGVQILKSGTGNITWPYSP